MTAQKYTLYFLTNQTRKHIENRVKNYPETCVEDSGVRSRPACGKLATYRFLVYSTADFLKKGSFKTFIHPGCSLCGGDTILKHRACDRCGLLPGETYPANDKLTVCKGWHR